MVIYNNRATYDYKQIESISCGIVLQGWEVKSIDEGKTNIKVAHCAFVGSNLCILNWNITSRTTVSRDIIQDENRPKILLLTKRELIRVKEFLNMNRGATLIPVKVSRDSRNKYKVLVSFCVGKKNWDKRQDIKKRDIERETNKSLVNISY